MSASHKRPPDERHTASGKPGLDGRPWLRRLIGLCLVLHLAAVAVAPFAVLAVPREEPPGGGPPRPRSGGGAAADAAGREAARVPAAHRPFIDKVEERIRPYLDFLYLNHGYNFFAPEPGPSYVIEYEVRREDGSIARGRLPDIERHRPRLLYHRYFMLATQNPSLIPPPVAGGSPREGPRDTLAHAILRHVMKRHGAERGVLRLYVHRLLWPEEVLQGKPLNDPDTYLFDDQIVLPPPNAETEGAGTTDSGGPAEEVSP